jgi:hypothetical protein
MSFADERLIKHHALLEPDDINAFIDGMRIEAPLLMFKALLLQSWCDLNDPPRKTTHPRLVFLPFCWLNAHWLQHEARFKFVTQMCRIIAVKRGFLLGF